MMKIFEKVFYLNTATWNVEEGKIVKITIMPSGVHKDEKGEDVLDGELVFYELENRIVLTEKEAFSTKAEVKAQMLRVAK